MQKLLNRLSQKSIERVTEETIVRWGTAVLRMRGCV